ncbi:MAG: leucine-rich repeat domain-containing protein [Prevotella sp.]|nr:leucine-rich repeat domain-containing protein [Prevotella sp.]
MSMTSTNLFAHDIAVENEDGVTIYYNYINDGKELEVTHMTYSVVGHPATYSGSVKIPETAKSNGRERKVTAIGAEAFYNCSNLTSVTIPNSVTTIGRYAFSNCSGLKSVKIYDLEAWCKISFASESANPLCYAHHLFLNDVEIKDLVIPNSVTTIGGLAFYKCSGLKSVTIPNSVTTIGADAFRGCYGLTSVTIGVNVKTIEWRAFNFTNRNGDLVEIYSHMKNPPTITTDVFSDALYNDASLYIPAGTLGKYKQTEYWNKFIWVEEIDYSTGIDSVVKQEDTDKRSYYTIDGTHIPAPQKGVNIVKTGDGKTKKVVVK